jgi:hypothetical protein
MRVGILAHSFSGAFEIYKAIVGISQCEVFVILVPPPHQRPWVNWMMNLGRFLAAGLKSFDIRPLRLLLTKKLIFLWRALDNPDSVVRLTKLNLDIGLHKTGIIYRNVTINAFRLGILNHHIGILPDYRGRSVLEWSLIQGESPGITVFFVDSGIDTGSRILIRRRADISHCHSVSEAKRYLFSLDSVFFREALELLSGSSHSFQTNEATGHRYFVMSKLLSSVADQLIR